MEQDTATNVAANARFFCHSCNTEIGTISTDYKCPRCLDGFIEELPPETETVSNDSSGILASEIFSNPLLTPILMSATGARPGDAYPGEGSSEDGNRSLRQRGLRRDLNVTNFDTILQDILISVGGGEAPSFFFTGNPGDYAWGREGLDSIVTQLLNQMDNSGPPPLDKEKIEDIPRVLVEKEQVDVKLQCSVCWEDFQLGEPVRKLPCTHIFHDNCIVPWLQCHGTCPICRQSLLNENSAEQQRTTSLSAAAQAVANTIRNVTSAMRPSSSAASHLGAASTSASSSTATSSMSQPDVNSINSSSDSSSQIGLFSPSSFLAPTTEPFPGRLQNSSNSTSNSKEKDSDGNIDYEFD